MPQCFIEELLSKFRHKIITSVEDLGQPWHRLCTSSSNKIVSSDSRDQKLLNLSNTVL